MKRGSKMKNNLSGRFAKLNLVIGLALLLFALTGAFLVKEPKAKVTAATDGIDEIVVVGADGYVYAYRYDGELVFKSSEGGWSYVTTGDLNRDGDHEIVAVGGSKIKVYDPQIAGEEYKFEANYTGSTGTFKKVEVGKFVGDDDRLDIALLRSLGGTVSRIIIYDTTNVNPTKDVEFKYTDWRDFTIGDYDGDGDDDFALIYWNANYPSGSRNWFELRKGHDPLKKLQDTNNAGTYSNDQWLDVASGNFVTDNGDRLEWAVTRNREDKEIVVHKWEDKKIREVWSFNTDTYDFITTADFRGDGDDQVAMLRNTTSGVSLQLARSGDDKFKPWSSISGLGTGWLNLAAGNLDTDAGNPSTNLKYKEVVIIKSNLIRVYLRPHVGQDGESAYLDCNVSGNCFEDFALASSLNGELAVGDLGVSFEKIDPFEVIPRAVGYTVVQSQTIPPFNFYVYGESTLTDPINWAAVVVPNLDSLFIKELAARDSNLSLTITKQGLSYESTLGSGQLPTIPWMTLNAYTGTTPSTVTVNISDTYPGSPVFEPDAYVATILILKSDLSDDPLRYIDVSIIVNAKKVYLPLIIR
jgi:hypothetical protein